VILDKDKPMNNVQKHNICTNLPSSQTFRSYKQNKYLHEISYLVFRNLRGPETQLFLIGRLAAVDEQFNGYLYGMHSVAPFTKKDINWNSRTTNSD
jgi:hypothetical protein